jgi:hypothetical protein
MILIGNGNSINHEVIFFIDDEIGFSFFFCGGRVGEKVTPGTRFESLGERDGLW